MKFAIVVLSVLAAAAAQTYSTENDDLDIEAVVNDPTTFKAFFACFLDTTPCDPVGAALKKDISEAMVQQCSKCTPAQKHIARRFLEVGEEKYPDIIQAFKTKYDPQGVNYGPWRASVANA